MHITIARKALLGILSQVKGAADPKAAAPVLANILLAAESGKPDGLGNIAGRLTVAATDLYRAARAESSCQITSPGGIALPAADIVERVRAMPEGALTLAIDGTRAVLTAAASKRRYALQGLPAGEFPQLPTPAAEDTRLVLPVDTFAAMLARVAPSVSTDTSRPAVNSALRSPFPGGVRMVSTDGHRLALAEATVGSAPAGARGILVPLSAISELRKLIDGASGFATLTMPADGAWAHLSLSESPGLSFAFKLLAQDVTFPPYQQVIPAEARACVARVNRALLADAVAKVALASSEKPASVALAFSAADGGCVKVTSRSAENGEGFDEVPATYTGADIRFGIRAPYFADCMAAVDSDEVDIQVTGELDPLVIRPAGGVGYIGVVMPVRL